jgi:hypothetical protein
MLFIRFVNRAVQAVRRSRPEGRQQARDSGHSPFRGPARGRSPRARISNFFLLNMLGANPASIRRHLHSSYCAGFNRSRCVAFAPNPTWKSVSLTHIRCRMLASLRATAVMTHNVLDRLAIRRPHARNADHFLTPQQQACSRLAKRLPNGNVALFADPTFKVDRRTGLVPPRRQAKMGAYRLGPGKAMRVINANLERQGCNGTDAGNRHPGRQDHAGPLAGAHDVADRNPRGSRDARPAWPRWSSQRSDRCAQSARGRVLHMSPGATTPTSNP